ncbi:MAG TPA: YihY family inner membrane protein [Dongiaceae bacterium]|nr:YihY family inner membrane protein [Dongiaceae bacterium]
MRWPRQDGKRLTAAAGFVGFAWRRFVDDRCLHSAAALSYSSLLAIVPLFAISLSILSAFPFFAALRAEAESLLVGNLMPHATEAVAAGLTTFIEQARSLTGLGLIGLAVTALMLLATIDGAFNTIWRVTKRRPLAARLMAYWAILTLGPLLFGVALSLSGVIYATGESLGGGAFTGPARWLAPAAPLVLQAIGFGLLYLIVPDRAVARRDAAIGGLVAALLFEALKRGFALYLLYAPAYETIYGALAAIPIFLVWMYASWAVTLFGAQVAAALPEWREARRRPPGQ